MTRSPRYIPSPYGPSPYRPGERTLAEIEADLDQPIPDGFLSEKQKGGANLTIFTWMVAQDALNYFAPGWTNDPVVSVSAERVVVSMKLCIPTSDQGLVCRGATGDDSEDDDDIPEFETEQARRKWEQEQRGRQFGSPTTRAEGQAFKRALARFGYGMYLRRKSGAQAPATARPAAQAPARPEATQKVQPGATSTKPSDRFSSVWKSLTGRGWAREKILAEVKTIAGNDFTEFSKLPEDVRIAVVEHLEGL